MCYIDLCYICDVACVEIKIQCNLQLTHSLIQPHSPNKPMSAPKPNQTLTSQINDFLSLFPKVFKTSVPQQQAQLSVVPMNEVPEDVLMEYQDAINCYMNNAKVAKGRSRVNVFHMDDGWKKRTMKKAQQIAAKKNASAATTEPAEPAKPAKPVKPKKHRPYRAPKCRRVVAYVWIDRPNTDGYVFYAGSVFNPTHTKSGMISPQAVSSYNRSGETVTAVNRLWVRPVVFRAEQACRKFDVRLEVARYMFSVGATGPVRVIASGEASPSTEVEPPLV